MNTTDLFETVGALCAPPVRLPKPMMVHIAITDELRRGLELVRMGFKLPQPEAIAVESLRIQLECVRIQQERAGRVAS